MPEVNPYQSPNGPSASEAPTFNEQPLASYKQRFWNLVFDDTICQVLAAPIMIYLATINELWLTRPSVQITVAVLLRLAYYIPQEYFWGRTIGKFITGTKVVSTHSPARTLTQIVGRTLCRFIPFEPFSFLFKRFPVGWHDRFSGTVVVSLR